MKKKLRDIAYDRARMIESFTTSLTTRDEVAYAWDCLTTHVRNLDRQLVIGLAIGETVQFKGRRDNGTVTGIVEEIGRSRVRVRATAYQFSGTIGGFWHVSPGLIRRVAA